MKLDQVHFRVVVTWWTSLANRQWSRHLSEVLISQPLRDWPSLGWILSNLQFPNVVVLNAVGRRNTQMRAKWCKWAQKSTNASPQKSAKGRKRALPRKNCKQPGLKQPGVEWHCFFYQGGPGSVRFGYGLGMERFAWFRFSRFRRFLEGGCVCVFPYSLAERTVPVSVPGKRFRRFGKTVPTVPVPVRFLGHPVLCVGFMLNSIAWNISSGLGPLLWSWKSTFQKDVAGARAEDPGPSRAFGPCVHLGILHQCLRVARLQNEIAPETVLILHQKLECRKWGFKRWGFKEIRGYQRKKAFFLRFLDFPGALGTLRKRAKKAEKGRFWPISANFQEGRPDTP